MKRCFLCIILSFISAYTLCVANPAKINVLIVTGGHGFKAEPFFQIFKDNPEITYTAASQVKSAEAYDRDDLSKFDVLVLYDAPREITEAQKARFLEFFERGAGVIVLHHAFLSYPFWPDYQRIAGGRYVYLKEQIASGLASSNYKGDVDIPVTIAALDHPVTAGLHDFLLHDELYTNMHMQSDVTPLLKTGDELLAWARMEKKSRVVGVILGHGPSAYQNANFRQFLAQSIHWVAGR